MVRICIPFPMGSIPIHISLPPTPSLKLFVARTRQVEEQARRAQHQTCCLKTSLLHTLELVPAVLGVSSKQPMFATHWNVRKDMSSASVSPTRCHLAALQDFMTNSNE